MPQKASNARLAPVLKYMGALTILFAAACEQSPTAPGGDAGIAPRYSSVPTPGYLIDTGPGSSNPIGNAQSLFALGATTCSPYPDCAADFQSLAGQFTLSTGADVTSVEGWMSVTLGGSLAVNIRVDSTTAVGWHIPGHSVGGSDYSVSPQGWGWKVFPNLNATLAAGTYWVTFEPVDNSGFNGSMQGTAASPLSDYAFFANSNNKWVPYSLFSQNPALGFRVYGTEASATTPEQEIADLKTFVAGSGAPKPVADKIIKSLNKVSKKLSKGQTAKACRELDKALKEVTKEKDKKLSASVKSQIISDLNDIMADLGC